MEASLWEPLVMRLYYLRRKSLSEGSSFIPFSHWWRSVLRTRELFKCGTTHSVGNGARTDFWSDIWTGNSSFSTQFPRIFELASSKNLRVSDCIGQNGWNWPRILEGIEGGSTDLEDVIQDLKATAPQLYPTDNKDEFLWRWTASGLFSVKSMYRFLQDSGKVDDRFNRLWSIKLPLKVKIFVWLVLRRRVLTRDILQKRNWSGSSCCAICLGPDEIADHLFLFCTCANSLLETLLPNKVEIRSCPTVAMLWEASSHKRGAWGRRELTTIATTWWMVWLERNRRVFDNKSRSLDAILAEIRTCRSQWSRFCT